MCVGPRRESLTAPGVERVVPADTLPSRACVVCRVPPGTPHVLPPPPLGLGRYVSPDRLLKMCVLCPGAGVFTGGDAQPPSIVSCSAESRARHGLQHVERLAVRRRVGSQGH